MLYGVIWGARMSLQLSLIVVGSVLVVGSHHRQPRGLHRRQARRNPHAGGGRVPVDPGAHLRARHRRGAGAVVREHHVRARDGDVGEVRADHAGARSSRSRTANTSMRPGSSGDSKLNIYLRDILPNSLHAGDGAGDARHGQRRADRARRCPSSVWGRRGSRSGACSSSEGQAGIASGRWWASTFPGPHDLPLGPGLQPRRRRTARRARPADGELSVMLDMMNRKPGTANSPATIASVRDLTVHFESKRGSGPRRRPA